MANRNLIHKHIEAMRKKVASIKAEPSHHGSVPAWRARAYTSACVLYKRANDLTEGQLVEVIDFCEEFLVSYNDSTGGYHDRWADMRVEFKERLECLQEEDTDEATVNNTVNTPTQNMFRCLPTNCRFCTHHGYLHSDTLRQNAFSGAYLCGNPKAERHGQLLANANICRHAVSPGCDAPKSDALKSDSTHRRVEYIVISAAGIKHLNAQLRRKDIDIDDVISVETESLHAGTGGPYLRVWYKK